MAIINTVNLYNSRFANIAVPEADLSGAILKDIHLGQWPALELKAEVKCCVYSADGRYLAVAAGNAIVLYDAVATGVIGLTADQFNVFLQLGAKGRPLPSEQLTLEDIERAMPLPEKSTSSKEEEPPTPSLSASRQSFVANMGANTANPQQRQDLEKVSQASLSAPITTEKLPANKQNEPSSVKALISRFQTGEASLQKPKATSVPATKEKTADNAAPNTAKEFSHQSGQIL